MGWNPFKKFGGKVRNINPKNQIQGELEKFRGTIEREILKKVKNELVRPLENKVNGLKNDILYEVKNNIAKPIEGQLVILKKDVEGLGNNLKVVAKDVFAEILSALASLAFKKYVSWLQVFEPKSPWFRLGPMQFKYELQGRLDYVKHIAKSPPTNGRGAVISIIRTLAPTEVELSASANLALGIGSQELGVGGGFSIETNKFISKIESVI